MNRTHVVIVTGAARGIGLALARGLAGRNMQVIGTARTLHGHLHQGIRYIRCDVTNNEDCSRVVTETISKYGRIDALINNAALGMNYIRAKQGEESKAESEQWMSLFNTNVVGPFRMMSAVREFMRRQGHGHIVNVTTNARTMTLPNMIPYGSTKAALEALTAAWAEDLLPEGISVNAVLPGGPCATDMILSDHALMFDETELLPPSILVEPVAWLLREAGRSVTGMRLMGRNWPHPPERIAA